MLAILGGVTGVTFLAAMVIRSIPDTTVQLGHHTYRSLDHLIEQLGRELGLRGRKLGTKDVRTNAEFTGDVLGRRASAHFVPRWRGAADFDVLRLEVACPDAPEVRIVRESFLTTVLKAGRIVRDAEVGDHAFDR